MKLSVYELTLTWDGELSNLNPRKGALVKRQIYIFYYAGNALPSRLHHDVLGRKHTAPTPKFQVNIFTEPNLQQLQNSTSGSAREAGSVLVAFG